MRTTLVLGVALLSASFCAFATRDGIAAPTRERGPLILTAFVQNGRTDVIRNEVLEFRFSRSVRRGSVDLRTLQVNEITAQGSKPAEGSRFVSGNVVRFDPRRSQANVDALRRWDTTFIEADRPDGLAGGTLFEVRIPAYVTRTLRALDGRRVAREYLSHFSTGHVCIDAEVGQPSFVGDHGTGVLGFNPPRSAATGLVDDDAVIVIEFSEPIRTESLVPGATVIVRRITTGADVTGTIVPDTDYPSGRRFRFVPDGGFGSQSPGQGWDIAVSLTTGITDIAGNALKRAYSAPVFRTRAPE
jgi:hypothetical protein